MILLFVALAGAAGLLLVTAAVHVVFHVRFMRSIRRAGAVGDKAVTGAADSLTGDPVQQRHVHRLPPADWGFQKWLD